MVIFVNLSFCNPAFPCRDLDVVEDILQVALDREEAETEETTASESAGLPVDKNQMGGY